MSPMTWITVVLSMAIPILVIVVILLLVRRKPEEPEVPEAIDQPDVSD